VLGRSGLILWEDIRGQCTSRYDVRISNLTASLLLAAMVAGCAREVPPPRADPMAADPILATDRVRDARAAIELAVTHCFPLMPQSRFEAELMRDRWSVWADFPGLSLSAEVAKRDGAVTNCMDIEV